MDNELPLSPAQSAKGLLDFSAKQSMNFLGHDLPEDPSFIRQSFVLSMQGMDISDTTPKKRGTASSGLEQRTLKYSTKLDLKKLDQKISNALPLDEDNLDFSMRPEDLDITEKPDRQKKSPIEGSLELQKLPNRDLAHKNSVNSTNSKGDESARPKSPTRKPRGGSFSIDRRSSDNQGIGNGRGGMSLVGLIAMARKMGLIKSNHAYEDYMSLDQFNMIKDLSTGRFDPKEEKRSEQMVRLKKKLLMNDNSHLGFRVHRKRTNLLEWKNNLVPSLKRMYRQFSQSIRRVITPNGKVRMFWDLYTMILIFYDLIMVPMTLSFDMPLPSQLKIWEKIMISSFILDIVLNFDTGFYYKGMLVMDRKRIVAHYLKGWFWIDVFASFPYEYTISDPDVQEEQQDSGGGSFQIIRIIRVLRFIKILRFVRVFKLKQLFTKLESYIDLSATIMSIIGFLKLCLIILFIAHWFACAWHFVSVWELENHPESWLTRHGVVDSPWIDRYVASIYWATTTMITVGYGDIVPITTGEKLLAILAMLVASAVFAYTMNRINLILTGLETTSEQYQRALATITDYMRKKHVKKELQIKIKKYLEYALEVETSLDSNEAYLNAYLNQSLKNELILEIHGKILLDNYIFMRFDNSLIMRAALILKEQIFSPEDPVFLENDANDDLSIYLIQSGRVEIFSFRTNSFLKILMKGSYFGEISFFTGQARSASVRSTDFSALYEIKRQEFLELLNEFPLEKEKFHEVKDKLSIYQDQRALNLKCYSCESSDHTVRSCPKVHAVVPIAKYISTYIERRQKFMSSYIRSGQRSNKNVERYSYLAEAAKRIQMKIWEGELAIDKTLNMITTNVDLPEFNEHPSVMLSDNRAKKIPASFTHNDKLLKKASTGEQRIRTPRGLQTMSSFDLETKSSVVNDSGKKEKEAGKKTLPSLLVTTPNSGQQKKERKKNIMYDDIDRIQNFVYYFPHNNFELQFPYQNERRGTAFDYFTHSNTTKDTLKRFVNILRERVRIRRELEASGKRRPSLFGKLVGGPARSRFYKERRPSSGTTAPSGVNSKVASPSMSPRNRRPSQKIKETEIEREYSRDNSHNKSEESP